MHHRPSESSEYISSRIHDSGADSRRRTSFSEYIRVLVGADTDISEKEFTVHKDVIIRRSSFFKVAIAERWGTWNSPKAIELPEDRPDTFGTYLLWIYTHNLDTGDTRNAMLAGVELVYLYVLADKLGDLESADLKIDQIIRRSCKLSVVPTKATINTA